MKSKKKVVWLIIILLCSISISACRKKAENSEGTLVKSVEEIGSEENVKNPEEEIAGQLEKGYDLPIDDGEREEAKADCKRVMEIIADIYEKADKGTSSNVVISHKTISQMQDAVKETKAPVTSTTVYSNMDNYEEVEDFLKACMDGLRGSIIIYEIHTDGGIGRYKYTFDGTDMYVLDTRVIRGEENEPGIVYASYNRIKEWEYTEKGWFCYELCVPELPEVAEIVDGSCLIRVKPMKKEYREISKKCVLNLGYQGNNLLCSNWDTEHLEDLDYNGLYEYLYKMRYQRRFPSEEYPNGVPKEEFESVIMEYIPITSKQIQKHAVFDKDTQTYPWVRLGCFTYTPNFFGTSIPEVTAIKENEDGTVTLTVDAVCEMMLCDEAVITHELTIQFSEDGSFQYLRNKVVEDGLENVPAYQYRLEDIMVLEDNF